MAVGRHSRRRRLVCNLSDCCGCHRRADLILFHFSLLRSNELGISYRLSILPGYFVQARRLLVTLSGADVAHEDVVREMCFLFFFFEYLNFPMKKLPHGHV